MPEYVLLYRSPAGYDNADADVAAWNTWLASIGTNLLDVGRPAVQSATVGAAAPELGLTGFSIIAARDMEAAKAVAGRCPALATGGAVEVGALVDLPNGHGPESD